MNFLRDLKEYDKDNIPVSIKNHIFQLIIDRDFDSCCN